MYDIGNIRHAVVQPSRMLEPTRVFYSVDTKVRPAHGREPIAHCIEFACQSMGELKKRQSSRLCIPTDRRRSRDVSCPVERREAVSTGESW